MSTGKQPNPRSRAPRKRSSLPAALYWSTFILCAGASFGAGFWFTYRYTSQVGVRGPEAPIAAAPVALATPVPLVTPEALATPQDLFAATPTPTPLPLPTRTPRPTPASAPVAAEPTQEPPAPEPTDRQAAEEATPEPTPEDVYRVQVGAYESREAAESMVQELLAAGIEAVVVYDQTRYHAQVGAYNSKERALAVADEVNAKGYAVTIRH